MNRPNLGSVFLAIFCFTGCSSVYTAYSPAEGTQNTSTTQGKGAVLVNPSDSDIWIDSVDGAQQGVPSHGQYRLLPGRHTIRVHYFWTRNRMTWNGNELADYTFNVDDGTKLKIVCQHTEEPGHGYNIEYKGTWKFWLENAESGGHLAAEDSSPIVTREATGELTEPDVMFDR